MIKKILFACAMLLAMTACTNKKSVENQGPEYCTVKGSIKGVKNGTKLVLQDAWNHYEEIETAVVENGAFEFHPHIAEPTHVYLYTKDGHQLKDFILEPGTIIVNVDADDEEDYAVWSTGTVSNDTGRKISELRSNGDKHAADSLKAEVLQAEQTGPLALYYATHGDSSFMMLSVLDRLTPDLAKKPFVAELREELTRRMKTEPRAEGSGIVPLYIDMEYPDVNGKPVSLSSVVNHPDTRYVLVDFWATWCGPCRAAVPHLKELYAKFHAKGLEIYSVSEDTDAKSWKSFLKENDMTWINVLDDQAGRRNSKAWYDYALHGIPTIVLIDCENDEIIARNNESELEAFLEGLLQ